MSQVGYDYIVVGGGTAGCVVANRLSARATNKVLLVEAGRDTPPGAEPSDVVDLYPLSYYNRSNMWSGLTAHWKTRYNSPQTTFSQARVMGGGSSVMGMVAFRGTPDDYDEWERLGAEGWGWRDVLPHFRKLERDLDFEGPLHSRDGEVPIRRIKVADWPPLTKAIAEYASAHGIQFVSDMNADFSEGFGATPLSNTHERRASSPFCFLDRSVRARANLTVMPDTTVKTLILEGKRVVGINAVSEGMPIAVRAREVILTCGGIFSPTIMMRSGIGPAGHLKEVGVEVAHHLPGVGSNLQNHPILFIAARLRRSARQDSRLRTHPTACFRYSSGFPRCPPADMYINIQSKSSWNAVGRQVANLAAVLHKPESKGQVRLTSPSPEQYPLIEFNFLAEDIDRRRLMGTYRMIVDVMTSDQVRPLFAGEPFPVRFSDRIRQLNVLTKANEIKSRAIATVLDLLPERASERILSSMAGGSVNLKDIASDDESLAHLIDENVAGVFHPGGSCRIGPRGTRHAVVDKAGKVHGLSGLRVADASLMPTLPRGNTNLPTWMIAEKIASELASADAL